MQKRLRNNCLQYSRPQNQRRRWHPTPVLLPGKSHGRRSLVGCSPWGRQELDTTERLPSGALLSDAGCSRAGPGWGLRRRAVRAKAALPDRLEGGRRAPLQPPVRPCSGGGAGPSGAGASQILGSFPLVLLATRLPAPRA